MAKKRTVNVREIWDIRSTAHSGSDSTLTFESSKHRINLHLGAYTIDYMAEKLWDIINERQKQVDSNKRTMRGD